MKKRSFHGAASAAAVITACHDQNLSQDHGVSHSDYLINSSEQLVGFGVRCWIAGCRSKDFTQWQKCWACYSQFFTPAQTRIAVRELACWTRVLESESARPIVINSLDQQEFSRDERMAISIIAACQHQACPALKACTEALIGEGDVEAAIQAAKGFAYFLDEVGMTLSPAGMNYTGGVSH